jgi:hypothetical protein
MNGHSEEKINVGGFAAVINSRLAAEARVARARAFGWVSGGVAAATCLTGLGVAAALYGYSYVPSVKPAAEQTAKAFVDALERSQIRTIVSGTMSLAANSEVKLAAGQTIRFEDGTTLKLDPNSSIRVIGDLKVDNPKPSKQQLQLDTTSRSEELPFTNYTIFRSVGYGAGTVVTGWHYELSDPLRPRTQHCYYQQSVEKGISAKYTIAVNGSQRRPSPLAKLSFSFDGAVANCIWFSGA